MKRQKDRKRKKNKKTMNRTQETSKRPTINYGDPKKGVAGGGGSVNKIFDLLNSMMIC